MPPEIQRYLGGTEDEKTVVVVIQVIVDPFAYRPDGSRPSLGSRQRQPDGQSHQEKTNRQQHTIAEPFNVFTARHTPSPEMLVVQCGRPVQRPVDRCVKMV